MEAHIPPSDIGIGVALYLRLWKVSRSPQKESLLSVLTVDARVQTRLGKGGSAAGLSPRSHQPGPAPAAAIGTAVHRFF